MAAKNKQTPDVSESLIAAKFPPPDWFGWLGTAAMFLLPMTRFQLDINASALHLFSLGEWFLLPLAVLSLTMGLLAFTRSGGKPLIPLWLSAVLPAVLWLAAPVFSLLRNGANPGAGDLFLSWTVRLVAPALVFLPLLVISEWRDRLMWALAGGLVANAVAVFWQARIAGIAPPDTAMLRCGGFLPGQREYGVMLALALPLLVAWRGGDKPSNKALVTLLCTFLLPVLALSANFAWPGLAAAAIGLVVAWAAWRRYAWILGVFLCLLLFGYGAEPRGNPYQPARQLLAESAMPNASSYREAFAAFEEHPFFGTGRNSGRENSSLPWYASLLGRTGLFGAAMWLALLGELAARAVGRSGKQCLWRGGVMGGSIALTVAGIWTDVLPQGAGALAGFLLAVSVLQETNFNPTIPAMMSPRHASRAGVADSPNK